MERILSLQTTSFATHAEAEDEVAISTVSAIVSCSPTSTLSMICHVVVEAH